jgi:hypothetical protein
MKLAICSGISIRELNRTIPDWSSLTEAGHDYIVSDLIENLMAFGKPDAIIMMSVSVTNQVEKLMALWPDVPLFVYHWDCYAWAWIRPRPEEYDYHRYGRLLQSAAHVWVPSRCTGIQANLWWGLNNWSIVRSSCPFWDHPDVVDKGYVLCALRELPDHWYNELEPVCKRLGLPLVMSNHNHSRQGYEDAVAGCRFIVSHILEASTGGLSLLEAYYLGKPVLITNSPWNGAAEYFGDRASYFPHDDKQGFSYALSEMYHNTPAVLEDHADYVRHRFNDRRMVTEIMRVVKTLVGWKGPV